jgi:DNA-binding CsgD family transcriptional regulator
MGELTAERQRTFESITLRRAQVLRELANDWTEREIAERLGISPSTVRSHLEAVKDILGLPSNRDVAAFGERSASAGCGSWRERAARSRTKVRYASTAAAQAPIPASEGNSP